MQYSAKMAASVQKPLLTDSAASCVEQAQQAYKSLCSACCEYTRKSARMRSVIEVIDPREMGEKNRNGCLYN